jgi:hypothetical protein
MLTRLEILQEYTKCIADPKYAIENFLQTFDKTQEGFVPFLLFPRQKQIVDAYEQHRFNIIAKPRQAGVSTTTAAYLAIKTGFGDPKNPEKILILANKQVMAQEFLSKVKDFLEQLPRWVWGDEYYGTPEKEKKTIFDTNSKGHLVLPNKCQIKAVATSKDALRGFTPTYLIMDEAAFIDNGEEVFNAALTALGTGGHAMLISTPNGMDKLYYTTYEGARTKDNDFNIIEMRWYEDLRYNKDLRWFKEDKETKETTVIGELEFTFESYDSKIKDGFKPTSSWYEAMCRNMNGNARMIAQELDVSFIGSGGNVINDEYIMYHEKHYVKDPVFVDGFEKEFWIWEQPQEGHQYIMGVDVARGDGNDSSTIVIIDFTTMEQVMEYKGKVQPDLLGEIAYQYGNLYKAYTVVDITGGMGVSTVLKLLDMDYKYLHYDDPRTKILLNKAQLVKFAKDGDKIPGFNVGSSRLTLVAHLERSIRENLIKIRSRRLTSEMKTFVYRNGRPDHMDGFHDDLLMALGMALWVLEHSFKNLEKLEKQTKAILDSWVVGLPSTTDNSVGGFVPKGNKGVGALPKPNFNTLNSRNIQDPKGEYLWLFSGMR